MKIHILSHISSVPFGFVATKADVEHFHRGRRFYWKALVQSFHSHNILKAHIMAGDGKRRNSGRNRIEEKEGKDLE